MTLQAYLEDFGSAEPLLHQSVLSDEALENERLEAFDKGYRAGWDDAIKAKAEETVDISTDFAQMLQDLSFTYHDVHAQVLSNLAPLFDEVLDKILPVVARDSLGAHIAEQLAGLAREIGTATVTVHVPPGAAEAVQGFVDAAAASLPVTVAEDPALAEGQADIRFGRREIAVDLAAAAAQITEAVHAVLYNKPERQAYG